jgi:hypothetical protein
MFKFAGARERRGRPGDDTGVNTDIAAGHSAAVTVTVTMPADNNDDQTARAGKSPQVTLDVSWLTPLRITLGTPAPRVSQAGTVNTVSYSALTLNLSAGILDAGGNALVGNTLYTFTAASGA